MELSLVRQSSLAEERAAQKYSGSAIAKWIEIMYNLIWAVIFWLALSKTKEDRCPNPVWFWVYYANYNYIASAIAAFVRYIALPLVLPTLSASASNITLLLVLLGHTIVRIVNIGAIVGASIAYVDREECPALATILTGQFYCTIFLLVVIKLVAICSSLSCLFASTDESKGSRCQHLSKFLKFLFPILSYHRNATSDDL